MRPRDLVYKTLEFENTTGRVPRDLWLLPWADMTYPEKAQALEKKFPSDIVTCRVPYQNPPKTKGNAYKVGVYDDEWGCRFQNIQPGIIGEVKEPIVSAEDEDWSDLGRVHIPYGWLSFDIGDVNEYCRHTDCFVLAGCCPRPFEQLQFLRGTEQLYMDLIFQPPEMQKFIKRMHAFYCELLEKWCKTEIDAVFFMDDWGSQNALLINPQLWQSLFKPMYRDYIHIAHRAGKKAFMHSDGNTLAIYPHMIELGLDAFNTQIFCIGLDNLLTFAGKITLWGEIDRQHLLPYGTRHDIEEAVKSVKERFWRNGGCIAQCEFGPGAKPDNVDCVFDTWNRL